MDQTRCPEEKSPVILPGIGSSPSFLQPLFPGASLNSASGERSRPNRTIRPWGFSLPDPRPAKPVTPPYLFHEGHYSVADKVLLVPFGEANPLPDWVGRWLNKIFFDGAPDYTPASDATDFHFAGKSFRAAVCYEGTSERLYRDRPRRIVMLSNNGWFYPSIEPVLQRLLLEYYHRKYGTEIWHAVNMGESYIITK